MTNKTRRALLANISSAAVVCALPLPAISSVREPRRLSFYHTHTRADLELIYHDGYQYVPEALNRINLFLRDFRTRDSHPIDPGLLDILIATRTLIGSEQRFEVISGYRSPATNETLRNQTKGVAKDSLHMQGRAIDIRPTGVRTRNLHRAALDLGQGGVGYYPQSDFIHLDTGDVRSW
ncbi:MAG: DUF882 domain-containing protein [Gammaproteobacteria bacterium]|nr:Twin-arginine translocation pathway signal [Chromatiales bacterium]MDP6675379.1 DUF882 domain-containing protein [Gammaproteobacteria bacterium]